MTESSSAGRPDGAVLPPDHPLGPAQPIPAEDRPAEREDNPAARTGTGDAGTGATTSGRDEATGADTDYDTSDAVAGRSGDGRPSADRREDVLDPAAGSSPQGAATIRDEQGTDEAGIVPAAFDGDTSVDTADGRRPEDAAQEPDSWDSGGR